MATRDRKQKDLFEQKQVRAIEDAYTVADAKRAEIEAAEKIVKALEDELKPLEKKLRETVHAYEDRVDHQKTEAGDPILVYKRDDFNVVIKAHERMTYEKVVPRTAPEETVSE